MRPLRPIFPRLLLFFLSFQLSTFSFLFSAPTQLGDVVVRGALTLPSGATVAAASGSSIDLSAATLTLPADVSRLGSSISLTSEIGGILALANGGTGTATPGLIAGSGVTISGTWPNQTIASTGGGSGGSGEANTASNLGSGTGLFSSKSGVDLRFKSLVAGSNVTLSSDTNTITIAVGSGSGGSSSPTTTEGDLIVRGSTADQRLAVGTSGQVLTVDPSQSGKLKWATAAIGGGSGLVAAPASAASSGTAGDLAVSSDFTLGYLCVATNTWKQFALAELPAVNTYEAVYASDGDTNGVFYKIGRILNSGTWANPYSSSFVTVSGSLFGAPNDPPALMDRVQSQVHLTGAKYIIFDFGFAPLGGRLALTKWNMENRTAANDSASSVIVEGSQDGASWTILSSVTGRNQSAGAWAGGTSTNTTHYRFIKMTSTDGNANFIISEIELYGSLQY